MKTLLASLALAFLLPAVASAADWRLLELREFSFDAYKLADNRDSYFLYEREEWYGGTAANFNLDLVRRDTVGLFWNNSVVGNGTRAQYREVLWRFKVGVDLGPKLQLYLDHESRHILDERRDDPYPLYNAYGARITFFKRKE